MKSYAIQHDYLFASKDALMDGAPRFDTPTSKREERLSAPVKVSSLLGPHGEALLDAYAQAEQEIILMDDLPPNDNPIVLEYCSLLIKGIIAEFHRRGKKVFRCS